MLLVLGAILASAWLFAVRGQYTAGSAFHLLLPLALLAVEAHFLRRRKRRTGKYYEDSSQQRRDACILKKPSEP